MPSAVPRWATPPARRANLAAPSAAVAKVLGKPFMPHQELIVGTGTEMAAPGVPAYRQVTVEMPRQQGKSVTLLSLMLARAIDQPGTFITYSAQTRLAGRKRFLDVWWPLIRGSGLRSMVDIRKGYGSEAFTFRNGSLLSLASGTETSDHGDSLDLAVIDEAWAQRDSKIEQALKPGMVTRPNAQLWIVSTAGNEDSHYFRSKVEDGRARAELGVTDTAAYFGWSAPDDADPGAEETWQACMPALGHTCTVEVVRADFGTMDLPEFRRAYLCQWPDVAKPGWQVIGENDWDACYQPLTAEEISQ